ncbi:Ig-like domain-containing protein [Inhella gelatinilytica]|uniref:Tandem-95 repeat protein n=1 Tax=Inhella gelatinilytica TaxID=2795030 RepID=A0A931IW26_9BURK|nr:Ig-like domain-containing protein [Inhella gelatinilytica]MBH9552060.1 tandem-95 repeat protein [Inhella gelatinilytica]
MADIKLTDGDDLYEQSTADRDAVAWNTIWGQKGNDIIKLYQGVAMGGQGNDRIEQLPTTESWRTVGVAYWDSPTGVVVDLASGIAQDGWGTVDTLIGNFVDIHGTGFADTFIGNALNNFFWCNGGADTVNGGDGVDTVALSWFEPAPGQPWRSPTFDELDIQVSSDGTVATVRPKFGIGFSYTLTNVEKITWWDSQSNREYTYWLADLITPDTLARQGLLAADANRWNASGPVGTAVNVSYSFVEVAPASGPGATGFRPFSPAERQVVRDLLAQTAALTQITFVEVSETGGSTGQMRFGVSQQAATKGLAYLPFQAGAGEAAGDVWMDLESMLALAPGTEGYQALLHEVGHALGLRHPRNTEGGDAWATQLRLQDDRTALTVMSSSLSPDGLFRADWGPLDVLALRYLYGTRTVGSGDTVYTLGSSQANAQTALVDDGGTDTLDASAYVTGVSLNLASGALSSIGMSSQGFVGVDNLGLVATTVIENAIGSSFDDVLLGNASDNRIQGGPGNDWIDGGAGTDTAVFEGKRSDYELSNAFSKLYVKSRDGNSGFDTLISIERLQFSDLTLTLAATGLGSDGRFSVDEDAALQGQLPDPAGVERSTVTYRLVGNPAHGTATVSSTGALQYTPTSNYWGWDWVAFEVVAATGANQYLAFVQVLPINDAAPVAQAVQMSVEAATTLTATLPVATDADGDAVVYSLGEDPSHGVASVSSSGRLTYTPTLGFVGTDVFSYGISDGLGGSNTYSITVTVLAGPNVPPVGAGGSATGTEDQSLAGNLPTAVDPNGDTLTYAKATNPSHGTVVVNANGTYTYTPAANYFGSDSFTFTVSDPSGASNTYTQSLTITPVVDTIMGGAGADTLTGTTGDDLLQGLAGDDRLTLGAGNDTLDGGSGFDIAYVGGSTAANFNLKTGIGTLGSATLSLSGIEAIRGSSSADTFTGLDGTDKLPGEVFRGAGGNDTINGGTGIDRAEYSGKFSDYQVTRKAGTMEVTVSHKNNGADGTDSLNSIELLVFQDRVVGFGQRAEDVARVAFVLWNPAIIQVPELFSAGLSFYLNEYGYSLNDLCKVALIFRPEKTAQELVATLLANTPGTTKTAAQLYAIMDANGGQSSQTGWAAAIEAMALDAATTQQIELMGVANGLEATMTWGGQTLFGALVGG